MFLLRRTATRAVAAAPSKLFLVQPRSIATYTPATFQVKRQQWIAPFFQKRFASDDVTKPAEGREDEDFAQTATETPVDEAVSPAQPAAQADAVDSFTGAEASEAVTQSQTEPPSGLRMDPGLPGKTLYVGNLYYEVTEEQIKRVFSRFGAISNVKIIYDNRGMSRGFAYVDFENIDEAKTAVENLDMQVFEGRNLVVQFHRPKTGTRSGNANATEHQPNPPSKTLFIGNMSFEMSDKDLNDLFRDIRNVMDVRVAIDRRTGQPRGFAHADFLDVASAVRAQAVLKEKVIYGRQLRVDFSRSSTLQSRQNRENTV